MVHLINQINSNPISREQISQIHQRISISKILMIKKKKRKTKGKEQDINVKIYMMRMLQCIFRFFTDGKNISFVLQYHLLLSSDLVIKVTFSRVCRVLSFVTINKRYNF